MKLSINKIVLLLTSLLVFIHGIALIPHNFFFTLNKALLLALIFILLVFYIIHHRIMKIDVYYIFLLSCLIVIGVIQSLLTGVYSGFTINIFIQKMIFLVLILCSSILVGQYSNITKVVYISSFIQALLIIAFYSFGKIKGIDSIEKIILHLDSYFKIIPSGFNDGSLRIISAMNPFLIIGLLYAYYCSVKTKRIIHLMVFIAAIYITKSIGLAASVIIAVSIISIATFFKSSNFTLLIIITIALYTFFILFLSPRLIGSDKYLSIEIKQQQILSLLDLDQYNIVSGNGWGYLFNNDNRKNNEPVIEVMPVFIIYTTGLSGFFLTFVILILPFWQSGRFKKYEDKKSDYYFLSSSLIALFFTGFTNPYILNGLLDSLCILLFLIWFKESQVDMKIQH